MATVPGQVFRLGTWEGSVEGVADFARQEVRTGAAARTSLETTHTEERLTLRNVGAYFYDPRLVTLSLGGTFGLSQEWLTTETGSASREGTLWGYDAFAGILPDQAYSLSLFANRNQSSLSRELAGRSEVQTENRGATIFVRRLYIPSTLTFRQELQEEESRAGDIVARREDRRNIITYEGQRGWIDSEMDLRYEFVDESDRVFPNLGFRSHEGSLNYSLDFGSELNWRWDSRLRVFTRRGVTELTTGSVDELLRIDHTDRLRTEYRYFLTHTDTPGGATTTHTGAFTLRHLLYESLSTTVGLDANRHELQGGRTDRYRSRLDFAYTKRLPGEGRLAAGLGGAFEYEEDRFGVTETFVPQESHTAATPFALPIPLDNPFVVVSSVVVTKVAAGPVPAGCIGFPLPRLLTEGVDYTLRTVGEVTEIVPSPCSLTTPGINPGDTIAVDYRFTVSPSLTFTTATWRADLSVDYRWIRPFFVHEQRDQTLRSGRDGRFLDDQRSDTVGTELRYDGQRFRASLLGEAQRFTSRRLAFDTARSNQFLAFTILPELTLSLSAEQAFTDFSNPEGRESRTLAGRATLTYFLEAGLSADAFAAIRDLKDTLLPDERTTEAGLRVRWLIRKLEVNPTLGFIDQRRGDTETKEYRATLHVIRRF